jgi:CobQ-like glutamine amidotransferase family enzyme
MKLVIGYLYHDLMNIYGDRGNVTALACRAKWRGIDVEIKEISIGDSLKIGDVDILFFGGGQDQGQIEVAADLIKKSKVIKSEVERGVPLLSICGGYQLLGKYYQPKVGERIEGIGLFDVYTKAGDERMIGNLVIDSKWGKLVGFENHSGNTYLEVGSEPMGKTLSGYGNNIEAKNEGCIYRNAIGCYMHGSLLPKNPVLADWLIKTALEVKTGQLVTLEELDDKVEIEAHNHAVRKFE